MCPMCHHEPLFCHPERSEGSPFFSPKMRCFASLSMTGWWLSPRAPFFVAPSEARGPFFLTKDEMLRFAQHDRMEDVAPSPFFVTPSPFLSPRGLFLSPRAPFLSPRAPFFVTPSASEGSLGAGVPREDTDGGVTPSASEGCLAIARQDKKMGGRQDKKMGGRGDKEGWSSVGVIKKDG